MKLNLKKLAAELNKKIKDIPYKAEATQTYHGDKDNKKVGWGVKLVPEAYQKRELPILERDEAFYEDDALMEQESKFDSPKNVYYQNNTNQSDKDYVASEKTIRDLAERIADRIGLKVKYVSDRTLNFKGKLEENTAVINLAYATLDTPIHEILGHPIIRALKTGTESNKPLYNNLLKELEYGKGKEVLDRIKRDYIAKENGEKYTIEEQQEEAIVELLGLYTADRLDKVKEGKLISLLKRLLKEMKAFMRQLFNQKEVNINELPDNMTLGDIADLLAYSNSKLILPGNEVVYTTPDNQTFKTYQEASNHISELIMLEMVNLDRQLNIKDSSGKAIKNVETLLIREPGFNYTEYTIDYEDGTSIKKISEGVPQKDLKIYDYFNSLKSFISKNKEYEQSKEIIEEWKKVNDIKYDPEEVYSRGQGFYSVVGAYSDFDVELMFQNLLAHIQDNKKAGGEFTISAFTKPIDREIGHLEGGGGKIKFKIFPKANDIKWAANEDVYSGSVWDASEKVSKDTKSELIGVSYTKSPALNNIGSVQPNLASIIDNLAHHHNELSIELTGSNFRLEYDDNVPYSTKKLIDNINKILDQKFGKLVEPGIKKQGEKVVQYGLYSKGANDILDWFDTKEEAQSKVDESNKQLTDLGEKADYSVKLITKAIGIQPIQTKENTTSIEEVKKKELDYIIPKSLDEQVELEAKRLF